MLARKTSLILIYRLFSMFANLVVTYFLARALGPTDYGILAFTLSLALIYSFLCDMGLNTAHLKMVAEGLDPGECLGAVLLIKGSFAAFWLLPGTVAFIIWVANSSTGDNTALILLALFPATLLQMLSTIYVTTTDARQEAARSQLIQLVQLLFYSGLTIGLTFFTGEVIYYVLGQGLQYILGIWLARRMLRNLQVRFPGREVLQRYLHFIRPLIVANLVGLFHDNTDRLFIQIFWNSTEVGYYAAADRISSLVLLLPASMTALLVAGVSAQQKTGEIATARELTNQSSRAVSLVISPIILIMIWFAGPLVQVFLGSRFAPATIMLQLLLLQDMGYALNRPVISFLTGVGNLRDSARLSATQAFLILVLTFIVVPPAAAGLGGTGMALLLGVSGLVGFVVTVAIAYYQNGLSPYWPTLIHLILAAGSTGLSWLITFLLFGPVPLLMLVTGTFLALLFYIILLACTGQLAKKDLRLVMEALGPRLMYRYIREEVR